MRISITGIGCVTPLGASLDATSDAFASGRRGEVKEIANAETGRVLHGMTVPTEFTANVSREPRLRRSSTISMLTAAAGKAALADSGIDFSGDARDELAVVLGVSSGGVQYTRRFYEQVVKHGATSASPLLFPETVYNAPASHLAAMLGVTGATYTLVGDCTVGLQALRFAGELIATGEARHVLIVAAEEIDWILLEGHRACRLTAKGGKAKAHSRPRTGTVLAEGAAAVLIGGETRRGAAHVHPGLTCFSRAEAAGVMGRVLAGLNNLAPVDFIVSGANGTWTDDAIDAAIAKCFPGVARPWLAPKDALGESLGASSLLQLVLAADALEKSGARRALVASLGWNQQAAAAVIERTAGS